MAQKDAPKQRIKITEACRYCPPNAEARDLVIGTVIEPAPEDYYNIIAAGRGTPTDDPVGEPGAAKPAAKPAA